MIADLICGGTGGPTSLLPPLPSWLVSPGQSGGETQVQTSHWSRSERHCALIGWFRKLKSIKAPYSGHFLPFNSSIWHKDRICYNDIYHMSLKTMIISSTYHTVFMWISGLDCSNLRNIWVCFPCSELWQTVMMQVVKLGRIGQVWSSNFSIKNR